MPGKNGDCQQNCGEDEEFANEGEQIPHPLSVQALNPGAKSQLFGTFLGSGRIQRHIGDDDRDQGVDDVNSGDHGGRLGLGMKR